MFYTGQEFTCECGRVHSNKIKEIIIGEGALERTPSLLKRLTDKKLIYLVGDRNTFPAAGNRVLELLLESGFKVVKIVLQQDKVVADSETVFEILEKVDREGYFLACGSGTINDLVKYVSHKLGTSYLVVATAPSMDGYASTVASITTRGFKKTFNTGVVKAIVADLDVLRKAPRELIQAGYGDLLGKITSLLDWRLGAVLFDEYFCSRAFGMVSKEVGKLLESGEKVMDGDRESIEVLIRGLIISGVAMNFVGSSRPASGSEHHISHFLELYGSRYNRDVPPHGVKVGLGVYFTSRLYLRLLELDFAGCRLIEDREEREKHIKRIYGPQARMVLDNLDRRWNRELFSLQKLQEREKDIKGEIEKSRDYLKQVEDSLTAVGFLEREDVKNLPQEWLEKALKYSFEFRDRFTVCTLLNRMDLLVEWAEDLLTDFYRKGDS